MIAWKVAVTHLTLDDGDLDFSDCGWVGLSDDTQTELIPRGKLSIDDHAIGDLPDEIAVVLAVGAYLQIGSAASHTLIVPAGATICFPKKHEITLCRETKLPPNSTIVWPRDGEHSDPEVMQVHTRANDRGLSLWITEGDEVTLPQGGELLFRPELASQSSASM
jgi:hypothetical protein